MSNLPMKNQIAKTAVSCIGLHEVKIADTVTSARGGYKRDNLQHKSRKLQKNPEGRRF